MKELKPGDRIICWGYHIQNDRVLVSCWRASGIVISSDETSGIVNFKRDDGCEMIAHRKQIRKVKPRIKKEGREFWLNVYAGNVIHAHLTKESADIGRPDLAGGERIRVREVLE